MNEEISVEQLSTWFGVPAEIIKERHPARDAAKLEEQETQRFIEYSLKPWLEKYSRK